MSILTRKNSRISAHSVLALLVLLAGFAGPAFAERIERTFDVRPGGTLRVDAASTSISIEGGSGDVVVEIERKNGNDDIAEDYDVDLRQDGDDVIVDIKRKRKVFNWDWRKGLEMTVRVPRDFNLDVGTSGGSVRVGDLSGETRVRTSGGSLRLGDMDGPVYAKTSGGSIQVERTTDLVEISTSGGSITLGDTGGSVKARTSGGSITIARARGDVVASTSGGSITIEEVAGSLDAKTSGGSIRAYLSEQPANDSRMSTSGGRVTVVLADGLSLDIDARASGGSVSSDVSVDVTEKSKSRLVGQLGGGGPALHLRASGGSVRIKSR